MCDLPDMSSLIYAYADLAIQTNPLQVASVGRPFVSSDVGYTLRINGGMGFNTGAYTIISVASGLATLDRPAGTGGSTAGAASLSIGGLYLEGFGVPLGMWPGQSDACPLPDRAHMCVVYRACLLRIIQKPTQENLARREMLEQEYSQAKGKLGREARGFSQATMNADNQRVNRGCFGYW